MRTTFFREFTLKDIRFWILLFFLIRLFGISNAPLETGHNWRQSLTSMIARNFLETDANILYPRIDMAGEATGIIGSEFPFFNYLIYVFALLFDYSHWAGRLINLVVSSLGIWYFYRIVAQWVSREVAFPASMVFLASIWFSFSRKIMPDTFSVALVIIGFYYGLCYLKQGTFKHLLLFFGLATLGILCKIPAASLLGLSVLLLFTNHFSVSRRAVAIAACMVSAGVVWLWYFYWVPYLLHTYGYQLYFPKGLLEGFEEILPYTSEYFAKFYFSALYSYLAFALALAGIYGLVRNKNRYLWLGLISVTAIFLVFTLKTGSDFPTHNYYIIPFVPVMALLAGYGVALFPEKLRYILLLLVVAEGVANQAHDFFIKEEMKYKLTLEELMDENVSRDSLIVINGGQSPQEIYFARRKGWTVKNDFLTTERLDSLSNLGAAYLVLNRVNHTHYVSEYPEVGSNESYTVYSLNR